VTQTNSKIQGKFYPLQHEEWLRACRELTPAQRDVLYYIRTLDPRNYGVEINAAEIARQLSSPERQVHRQTVSRALKELDAKGFIDLELLQVKVKVKPKGLWCDETPGCDETPCAIATHRDRSPHTTVDRDAPCAIATHHAEAETHTQQKLHDTKINKSYIELIQTLSDSERENFEKFVREEWKKLTAKNGELGEEIVSLERFLAREEDIKNWHQRFLNSAAGRAAKTKAIATLHDWRNDSRFGEWIQEAFNRGYEWVHENESEREQRKAFYDWAMATNAFEGVCL
jgi:hypothetical protein